MRNNTLPYKKNILQLKNIKNIDNNATKNVKIKDDFDIEYENGIKKIIEQK